MSTIGQGRWILRLQRRVRGIEVFTPDEPTPKHPAPGNWVVMGPTSEFSFSVQSADHAAMLFLAHYCDDIEAQAEAAQMAAPESA
jgi:hypothetical protein